MTHWTRTWLEPVIVPFLHTHTLYLYGFSCVGFVIEIGVWKRKRRENRWWKLWGMWREEWRKVDYHETNRHIFPVCFLMAPVYVLSRDERETWLEKDDFWRGKTEREQLKGEKNEEGEERIINGWLEDDDLKCNVRRMRGKKSIFWLERRLFSGTTAFAAAADAPSPIFICHLSLLPCLNRRWK